jgi:hypothetical protein
MFSYHFILLAYLIHSISSFCNTFICTTIYSINLLISHFNKISTKFPFNFLSFQHLHFLFSNIITIHFFYHITIVKHTFRSISSIINRNLIFFITISVKFPLEKNVPSYRQFLVSQATFSNQCYVIISLIQYLLDHFHINTFPAN